MTDQIIGLSVRGLAEYAHRSGSIESGFRSAVPLAEGTRIHKRIQERYVEPDRSEVHLAGELEQDGFVFRLEGRCDGLRFEDGLAVIEEIKSTAEEFGSLPEEGYPVHWAQAYCYAYLYARGESRSSMGVRLLYVQSATGEERCRMRYLTFAELQAEVEGMVELYVPYARMETAHRQRRNDSAKALNFPYQSYREGQRHLAGAVYKTIVAGCKLFARAPTGTGKTVSTLFPAVKAIGEGHLEKLFYVTARTTTRAQAEEALALMERQGLCLHSVTLTAKDKICFLEEVRCGKETCPYADGYYDRINGALLDLLGQETAIPRSTVERYARKHMVCPFELSLDAAYAADAVIGDYNYVFDPRIALKRLWEEDKRQTVVLVDEAHNLIDRAREMYSAELVKEPFLMLQRSFKKAGGGLYEAAKAVNGYFISLRKAADGQKLRQLPALPEELLPLLEEFAVQAERELAAGGPVAFEVNRAGAGVSNRAETNGAESEQTALEEGDKPVPSIQQVLLETYFEVQGFIRIAGYYDERYTTYAELARNEVRLKLLCLDPAALLKKMGKGYRSHVFFSATLSPLGFYRELLGGDMEEDYTLSIPSPFRKEQLTVKLAPLSVRYRDREASIPAVADLIHGLLREHHGNTLIFFSSYEYMNAVYERFAAQPVSCKVLVQHAGMNEPERDSFLAQFRAGAEPPVLAFAVLGGIFSEGIDLTGDRLTAVMVVGVGLPQVGTERELIKRHYDGTGRNGFDYAYVYPGISKVLQAGGRLIRTERDTGTLWLVDDRFGSAAYQQLLPEEWKPLQVAADDRELARQRWRRLYEPL